MDLFGALLGFGGGLLQNIMGQQSVQQQQRFQIQSRRHAYQDAVYSMEEAGLNPALAYSQGPAAAAQGATYQPVNMANSALEAMRQAQEINKAASEIANVDADTLKKEAEKRNVESSTTAVDIKNKQEKPRSQEMETITELYNRHPSLKKAVAIYDAIMGRAHTLSSTAKQMEAKDNDR